MPFAPDMEKEKVARINELARLAKTRPLTAAEEAERRVLREEYLRDFRASFGAMLASTVIEYPDGTREKLQKKEKESAPAAVVIETDSEAETEAAGAALAKKMETHDLPRFVAFYGDLGAGKTAFIRGFAGVFAPEAKVKSPTFALVHEYRGDNVTLFHFDLYRITGEDDLASIGFDDYLARGGICLAEWCENIPFALPPRFVRVRIEKVPERGENHRKITIEEECLC